MPDGEHRTARLADHVLRGAPEEHVLDGAAAMCAMTIRPIPCPAAFCRISMKAWPTAVVARRRHPRASHSQLPPASIRNPGSCRSLPCAGGGPYLAYRSHHAIDPALCEYLRGERSATPPVRVAHSTGIHANVAVTGGHWFSRPFATRSPTRPHDGLDFAVGYHYLHGLASGGAFDLDGQIEIDKAAPSAVKGGSTVATSRSGRGRAIDAGIVFVVEHWGLGIGAVGLGNGIRWRSDLSEYTAHDDLSFTEQDTRAVDRDTALPVDFTGNVAYYAGTWSAVAAYAHEFLGHPGPNQSVCCAA